MMWAYRNWHPLGHFRLPTLIHRVTGATAPSQEKNPRDITRTLIFIRPVVVTSETFVTGATLNPLESFE